MNNSDSSKGIESIRMEQIQDLFVEIARNGKKVQHEAGNTVYETVYSSPLNQQHIDNDIWIAKRQTHKSGAFSIRIRLVENLIVLGVRGHLQKPHLDHVDVYKLIGGGIKPNIGLI